MLIGMNWLLTGSILCVILVWWGAALEASSGEKVSSVGKYSAGKMLQFLVIPVLLWLGQQHLSHIWSSKIVIDVIVTDDKLLKVFNVGRVDIEDIQVFATTYTLHLAYDKEGHVRVPSEPDAIIETYSEVGPIATPGTLKVRDNVSIDVCHAAGKLLPCYEDIPDWSKESGRTYYALRVMFRNAITKQKQVIYRVIYPFKKFPSALDDHQTGVASGGGYLASQALFKARRLIKDHQAELFSDPHEVFYGN